MPCWWLTCKRGSIRVCLPKLKLNSTRATPRTADTTWAAAAAPACGRLRAAPHARSSAEVVLIAQPIPPAGARGERRCRPPSSALLVAILVSGTLHRCVDCLKRAAHRAELPPPRRTLLDAPFASGGPCADPRSIARPSGTPNSSRPPCEHPAAPSRTLWTPLGISSPHRRLGAQQGTTRLPQALPPRRPQPAITLRRRRPLRLPRPSLQQTASLQHALTMQQQPGPAQCLRRHQQQLPMPLPRRWRRALAASGRTRRAAQQLPQAATATPQLMVL